jgi:hypothetical protein
VDALTGFGLAGVPKHAGDTSALQIAYFRISEIKARVHVRNATDTWQSFHSQDKITKDLCRIKYDAKTMYAQNTTSSEHC